MSKSNYNNSRISIVLATYNGAKYLVDLLNSLEQQILRPFEIIVCDDGSQDQTLEILNQYKLRLPLTIHLNEQPTGVVRNFQKGVALCTGDYIAFCDQDDIWLPHKLAQSVAEIKKIDGIWPAMVFTNLTVVDQNLNLIADSYWQHRGLSPQKETFASLIYGNIVTGCTMVINRSMATEVARMPVDVLMHDFWIACIAYGIGQRGFIDEPTVLYRQHSANVTNNDAITWNIRLKKLVLFLQERQQSKLFLMPEIHQARLFADLYGDSLSRSKKYSLHQLFALGVKPPLFRKWRTFLIKFLHISPNSKPD